MELEMEEWLKRMMSQFVRQVRYSGNSAVWVLPKENWETAHRAVDTLFDRDVVVVRSSSPPNSSSLSGNLEILARVAQSGNFVLVLIDDANCPNFINLLTQLVSYGGRIRHDQMVFAFGIDTFTIHKDFYFSVLIDPSDYDKTLKMNVPKDNLGPVFFLNR